MTSHPPGASPRPGRFRHGRAPRWTWVRPSLLVLVGCGPAPTAPPDARSVGDAAPLPSGDATPGVRDAAPLPPPPPSERDAGPAPFPPPGTVSVIVAQGSLGRTTISCDDGRTWIANRSFDLEGSEMVCGDATPVVCGVTACRKRAADGSCSIQMPCDCGHEQGFPKGIVVAQNSIVANFGWGNPGVTLRSVDGVRWEPVYHHDANYNGLAFGLGRFIHFSTLPTLISDDGVHWSDGPAGYTREVTPRAFSFLDDGTGRFIGAADGNLIRVSSDRGLTWVTGATPEGCLNGIGNGRILTGNGVAVVITDDGRSCRSADGGLTWTLHDMHASNLMAGGGVFANGRFMAWGLPNGLDGNAARYSSVDGVSWTESPTNGPATVGAVGVTTEGTLVATAWFWSDYERQSFIRSTDGGLTWTAAEHFEQSHQIYTFASGRIPANALCPAR